MNCHSHVLGQLQEILQNGYVVIAGGVQEMEPNAQSKHWQ